MLMDSVTAAEIARLETMTISKLVEKFESVFGERCRSRNKRYLIRRIAWRLQANAEEGLAPPLEFAPGQPSCRAG
jgi:hypothetical protein